MVEVQRQPWAGNGLGSSTSIPVPEPVVQTGSASTPAGSSEVPHRSEEVSLDPDGTTLDLRGGTDH
jgi:hypothetical protein